MSEFFYIDNEDKQKGPLSVDELRREGITPQTPVWRDGMDDWTPAGEVEELKPLFQQSQQPPHIEQPGQGYGYQQPPFGQQQYQQPPYGSGTGFYNPYQRPLNQQPIKPDNWLVWAILCTVFCCLPFGIAGIVYAAQVDSLWNQGKYDEAIENAKKAKKFTLIGAICTAASTVLYFLFMMIATIMGMSASGVFYAY